MSLAQEMIVTPYDQLNVHSALEQRSPYANLKWYSLGPSFMGGRIETIDCPLDQPGVIYAGFGSGGLWKTTNFGLDWTSIFSTYGYSIGDIAISLSDPETVWVGTGENLRASRGFSYPGSGVYKSTNGGQTWTNMGLHDSHHIARIVMDPRNPNRVFVAVMGHFWTPNKQRGIFMTDDGGKTWQHILYLSDSVGASDVVWDARNAIIYAASWQFIEGKGSGIYKSSDLGKSWVRLQNGFPSGPGVGRIGLTISPVNPNRVYAVVDNRNQNLLEESKPIKGAEVYRSEDQGKTWKKTHKQAIQEYSGFGWAFGDLVASPVNSDIIYLLGVHLLQSTNGGESFTRIRGSVRHLTSNRGDYLHLDQHDLHINPLHPEQLILGNDGGVFASQDGGNTWLHLNTIPTGEFYHFSLVDGDPIRIYGGTQDNSSIYGEVSSNHLTNGGSNWKYIWLDPWSGGDGFTTIEDPSDPNFVYYESQNGFINRKNKFTGETKSIKPVPEKDERPLRNSWFTPYFVSRHDKETLYYAANKVYKSINKGDSWIRLSHDLCYSANKEKNSRSITALAESPINRGYIVAGTEKGIVWVSRNDGSKWFEISEGIPIKKVVSIVPSQHHTSRIYLIAKGMDDDDQSPFVYKTDNLGANWHLINDGLPQVPVNCILEDPVLDNILLIGTDYGVFLSEDEGNNWTAISHKLPITNVIQLAWGGNKQFLFAATHGSGLFRSYFEPIRRFIRSGSPDEYTILGSLAGKLPAVKDFAGDWNMDTLEPLVVSWHSPMAASDTLTIADTTGQSMWVKPVNSTIGLNQFFWDLSLAYEPDNSIYPIPVYRFPEPGIYNLSLKTALGELTSKIEIRDANYRPPRP